MKKPRILILNYHELIADGNPPDKFTLRKETFKNHLELLKKYKTNVVKVSDLFATYPLEAFNVAICVDDGYMSDVKIAAPILSEFGYSATFYPVANFINTPKRTTTSQLNELLAHNFEIGSHGLTHDIYPGASPEELRNELKESKTRIKELLNCRVQSFSTPHGWVNRNIVYVAKHQHYQHLLATGLRINRDPKKFVQYKWNMTENSTELLEKILQSQGKIPFPIMMKEWCKRRLKSLLGPKLIDRIGS